MDDLVPRIYSSSTLDFIEAALRSETDDCILWPFAIRKSSNYPAFQIPRGNGPRSRDAHSFVCEKAHGPKPTSDHETAHSCGRKPCINPKHVSWRTRIANMSDAKRHGALRGGGRYRQRIFDLDRAEIKASKDSLVTIAARYGMEPAHIGRVRRMPLQFDL